MEELSCRLLPFDITDGPTNMATDEVLLQSAAAGVATLRFYGWSPPTLSLGYFQSEQVRLSDPLLAMLPFVRRPSGGQTLVHHHEVTYALALPAGIWQRGKPWSVRMHEVVVRALVSLGVEARLWEATGSPREEGPLCFRHLTPGDVVVHGAKVVGSAQRKHRGAIMQHGGILLGTSPHTPALLGICELVGVPLATHQVEAAVQREFVAGIGVRLKEQSLAPQEQQQVGALIREKYASSTWNGKR